MLDSGGNEMLRVIMDDSTEYFVRVDSISSTMIDAPEEALALLWKQIKNGEAVFITSEDRPWTIINPDHVYMIDTPIWA